MAARESFAERLLAGGRSGGESEGREAVTGERQLSAQSHTLTALFKDGRKRRGFAMSHYSDYEWTEECSGEKLVVLFGNRALVIEGELLDEIVALVETGRLTHVREMTHREVEGLRNDNPDRKPIVMRVTAVPDVEIILSAMKGEEHETR